MAPAARLERIDTLRGIAVFGILLVNVWAMVHGASSYRYGVQAAAAPLFDQLVILLTAAFAEAKFYPIFSFLFGAGFALQTRSLWRALGDWAGAKALYRRRLGWLLGCGLAHGFLVWFGDILAAYAVTGFLVLGLAGSRLRTVRTCLRWLLVGNLGLLFIVLLPTLGLDGADLRAEINLALADMATYTTGGWPEAFALRARDYAVSLFGMLFIVPELALLFLLGVMAVRLGYLTRPARHRAFWRKVQRIGLGVGLPVNLLWGFVALGDARAPQAAGAAGWAMAVALPWFGPLLAAGYVATVMLARRAGLARWLAPVGRMALSNYLMQSVLGVALLQGVGLGLGARLPYAGLFMYCLCVMALQAGWSHWWLARHAQGPVEALWRRHTMAGIGRRP
ncbi:DUF418 domain-containing protein [Massilia glaciei]|uniref:DUF418 domain-containing protein n=1 Tax=Massilia glaciei TaxID=1524097 RepID=A0A2U2HJG3_9BURK|nr:DUF418 domain-containing protein [Massilia glaciei]PWF47677.1 DUF418 domain-containing protein [Massilia glaciei]